MNNKVALVTGASRGIGRGIVLALARLGHDVVINYASNEEAAKEAAALCRAAAQAEGKPVRIEICRGDISLQSDRQHLLDFTKSKFGRIDLLVNNAGVAPNVRADILEATEESFDRLIRTNTRGPFLLTQAFAKWMIELVKSGSASNTASGDSPRIIFVSSISAYTASVNRGDYCVSKAALSMLTGLFASRLAEFGINVYEIRPGVIATDMTGPVKEKYDRLIGNDLTPIRRWGQPEDIGKAVAAIAMGLFPFSTGEVFNVDGGFHLRRL